SRSVVENRGTQGGNTGGGRGIRTPDTLSGIAVFKTACFNRSHIPPRELGYSLSALKRCSYKPNEALPAAMDLPLTSDTAIFDQVVRVILCRCEARVVCQHANPHSNTQAIEHTIVIDSDLPMLL